MKEVNRDALLIAAMAIGYMLGRRSAHKRVNVQYIFKIRGIQ